MRWYVLLRWDRQSLRTVNTEILPEHKVRKLLMSGETLEKLAQAVIDYEPEIAANLAQAALEQGIDPLTALAALTDAIREVGDGFERGDLWLPDLIAASEAMSAATAILEDEIERTGAKQRSLGTVVIGTVSGDIHDIGKNMVSTMLMVSGFEVHDLGINIAAEQFIDAIIRYDANILAMSALLSTTAPEQKKVIEMLDRKGLREGVQVMVGGGGLTRDFAEGIGADGYEPTAPAAVKLARRFVGA